MKLVLLIKKKFLTVKNILMFVNNTLNCLCIVYVMLIFKENPRVYSHIEKMCLKAAKTY